MSVQKERQMATNYGDPVITGGVSVFDPAFDEAYYYDGNDLGAVYSKEQTCFRLWAPTAGEAWVYLYDSWNSAAADKRRMRRDIKGTWVLEAEGDLAGFYYTYAVKIGDELNEAVDPYARAVGVNGDKGYILAPGSADPDKWTDDKPPFSSHLDAVIYEIHIRDATIHPASGARHKGKFLGLSESGTKGPGDIPTGLDHIVHLGVTHVQLLPVYDFATESVDETKLDEPQYNWGYDPKNYNVPEGSYSTDPYDPAARIRELKELIQAFHDRGLRVVMDVVYNHVFDGHLIHFSQLVPGYYLRYTADRKFSNGSGCGNDMASERPMVSKYILESVLYWAKEYHIDGFRFDLMGLLDLDTINELRRRLDELDPSILLYGEGWNIPTELAPERQASMANAARLPGIGHFSDLIRNAIKGDVFNPHDGGFIAGTGGLENQIRTAVVGGISYNGEIHGFSQEPVQSVNYAECHDNYTMWDKIVMSTGSDSALLRPAMHRLGSAIILTSQGLPFIHAGQEFLRSKDGVENSYNAGDMVNRMDWDRCNVHHEDVVYMRELIAFRKKHAAFRLQSADLIRQHLHFELSPYHSVAYTLRDHAGGDEDRHLYVIYNANRDRITVELPPLGNWEARFGKELVGGLQDGRLEMQGIGMVVLGIR